MKKWTIEDYFDIKCDTNVNAPYVWTCTCKKCGYTFNVTTHAGEKDELREPEDSCVRHVLSHHLEKIKPT